MGCPYMDILCKPPVSGQGKFLPLCTAQGKKECNFKGQINENGEFDGNYETCKVYILSKEKNND